MSSKYLSDNDRIILQKLVVDVRGKTINTPSRFSTENSWDEAEDHQSNENYIVFPQTSSGIPGRIGFVPGRAVCDIYRAQNDVNNTLGIIGNKSVDVFNLDSNPVSQEFRLAKRDKFGNYIISCGTSPVGTGSQTVECICCPDGTPLIWQYTLSGITDDACTNCTGYNGTFNLIHIGACNWTTNELTPCFFEFDPNRMAFFSCGGTGQDDNWELLLLKNDGNTIATYSIPEENFDCLGTNTLDFVSSLNTCGTWPTTALVFPA